MGTSIEIWCLGFRPHASNFKEKYKNEGKKESQGYLNLYPINSDIRCQISKQWIIGPVGANGLNDSKLLGYVGLGSGDGIVTFGSDTMIGSITMQN